MDTDLNEIKNLFNRTKKHRLTKRLIALTLALLLIGAGGLTLRPRGKETFSLSCRISAAQKDVLTDLVKRTRRLRQNVENGDLQGFKSAFQV